MRNGKKTGGEETIGHMWYEREEGEKIWGRDLMKRYFAWKCHNETQHCMLIKISNEKINRLAQLGLVGHI